GRACSSKKIPRFAAAAHADRARAPLGGRASGQGMKVSFAEAFRFWLELGFISFGGPTGQIAIMHQELVERRRWISEGRFLRALKNAWLWTIAAAAFIAIFAFHAPFPAIVIAAAIIGYFGGRFAPQYFAVGDGHRAAHGSFGPALIDDDTPTPTHARFSWAK